MFSTYGICGILCWYAVLAFFPIIRELCCSEKTFLQPVDVGTLPGEGYYTGWAVGVRATMMARPLGCGGGGYSRQVSDMASGRACRRYYAHPGQQQGDRKRDFRGRKGSTRRRFSGTCRAKERDSLRNYVRESLDEDGEDDRRAIGTTTAPPPRPPPPFFSSPLSILCLDT